jgi:hypothetical protein
MTVMDYRTRDGLADYGFSIEYRPGVGWRAYVVFFPIDIPRSGSMLLPYQSVDHDGRPYIDWSGRIASLGDAKTVAALWAELIQRHHANEDEGANRSVINKPGRIKRSMPNAA